MNKNNETVKKSNEQWTGLLAELFNRLTGKGARVNYTFENLIISQGPLGLTDRTWEAPNGRSMAE